MKNKKISKEEAKKLLINPNSYKKNQQINEVQKITEKWEEKNLQPEIWTISDSTSTFQNLTFKNG